jgi:UDP-N-acetylmuramate--alanine ligase
MEYRGTFERALLFDDYAHHPTEIKATLAAFREKYPRARIICVFQPHQAKRLKYLFKEFSRAFDDADALVLLPLYRVAGRDTADTRYSSEKLASALFKKRANVWYLPARRRGALARALSPLVRDRSAIVVMMGAGDIAEETDALLKT